MRRSKVTIVCFAVFATCAGGYFAQSSNKANIDKGSPLMVTPFQTPGDSSFAALARSLHEASLEHQDPRSPTKPTIIPDKGFDTWSPKATALIEGYQQSRKQDLDARWAMIEDLGELKTKQSADFLASIAAHPLPSMPMAQARATSHAGTQGCDMGAPSDQMLEMAPREWSAAALVRMYVQWSPHPGFLASIIEGILSHADPQVAQYAAMTLFSHDALTQEHRALLDARGVFHDFRFLDEEEQKQLFRSDHIALAPQLEP